MQGAKMAETPNRVNKEEDDDDAPPLVVPSHDPLPPPPDISYTRPTLGKAAPMREQNRLPAGPRGQSAPSSFNLGTGMSAGITLASSVVVGFLIGQWIDHHWHLSMPWGTIIFSLTGVTAGFLNLFRILGASDDHRKQ